MHTDKGTLSCIVNLLDVTSQTVLAQVKAAAENTEAFIPY